MLVFGVYRIVYSLRRRGEHCTQGAWRREVFPLGCFIPDRRCLDYGNLDLSGRLPDFRIKIRAAVGAAAAEGERG